MCVFGETTVPADKHLILFIVLFLVFVVRSARLAPATPGSVAAELRVPGST